MLLSEDQAAPFTHKVRTFGLIPTIVKVCVKVDVRGQGQR